MVEKSSSKSPGDEKSVTEGLSKDVYVIAQEIKIVRSLASHDPIQRGKQLRKLQKWLGIRSNSSFPFTEDDFLRLWKGLYFCMWMCDKPLNQENLAEDLGQLLKCFNESETSIQFFGAFLKTMCLEWFGIDQWRMDKFMMLVRRMFRAIFRVIKDNDWTSDTIDSLNSQLSSTVLKEKAPVGLAMHVMDIFLEELGKISNGEISTESVVKLLKPFCVYLATQKELKLLGYARNRIFYQLLWQSELGREYMEKYNAWKEMGFPTDSINSIEKVEEDTETSENEGDEIAESPAEKVLDPRAGNVDVFIPPLPVDAKGIIENLEEIQYTEVTNTKSRRFIQTILEKCKIFETGEFPLGVKKMPKLEMEAFNSLVDKKVTELENFEDTIYGTTRNLKKLNKKKRRKLLSSLNFEELNEETFEDAIKGTMEGSRKRKQLSSISDEWLEEDIPQSSQASDDQKSTNDTAAVATTEDPDKKNKNKRKKLKHLKQNGKFEKENSSNAANHKELSNSINDWNESETTTPQNLASVPVESVQNESNSTSNEDNKTDEQQKSEWNEPLIEGEMEYFIPSRKLKLKQANTKLQLNCDEIENSSNLVLNPFAKNPDNKSIIQGKGVKKAKSTACLIQKLITTPQSQKKVKIVLQKNTIQKPSDYIQQVKSSPQLPYDAEKMPSKSLLKPNLTPSPINPFYKKKIGLKFNESF